LQVLCVVYRVCAALFSVRAKNSTTFGPRYHFLATIIMATVILVANAVVTVLLAWMTLNHFQLVEYDPMDIAVNQFQRLVFYSQLDGSVRAPPETFMTVVSKTTVIFLY
jgi:hypothetical protein